jgi:hypothetical protein
MQCPPCVSCCLSVIRVREKRKMLTENRDLFEENGMLNAGYIMSINGNAISALWIYNKRNPVTSNQG